MIWDRSTEHQGIYGNVKALAEEDVMTRKIMMDKEQNKKAAMPELDLTIATDDTSKLQEQLQKSPTMYWEWAKLFEKAKKAVADLKLQIKIMESDIANRLRSTHDKISEARIEKSYFDDNDYRVLHQKLNIAKQTEGNLGAVLRAIEHKHSIMITVASLLKAELRQQL